MSYCETDSINPLNLILSRMRLRAVFVRNVADAMLAINSRVFQWWWYMLTPLRLNKKAVKKKTAGVSTLLYA